MSGTVIVDRVQHHCDTRVNIDVGKGLAQLAFFSMACSHAPDAQFLESVSPRHQQGGTTVGEAAPSSSGSTAWATLLADHFLDCSTVRPRPDFMSAWAPRGPVRRLDRTPSRTTPSSYVRRWLRRPVPQVLGLVVSRSQGAHGTAKHLRRGFWFVFLYFSWTAQWRGCAGCGKGGYLSRGSVCRHNTEYRDRHPTWQFASFEMLLVLMMSDERSPTKNHICTQMSRASTASRARMLSAKAT